MFFEYTLVIPKDTVPSAAVEREVDLAFGVLTRVIIQFPPGCAGLVGVQIYDRYHQLFPSNPDEWFMSDNYVLDWAESYELFSIPTKFKLRGYNYDDSYWHMIYFRFQITHPSRTLEALIGQQVRGAPLPQVIF